MSSQKREMQRIKREKAIRKAKAKKSVRNILIGLAILFLVALIGYIIYYNTVLLTRPIDDYSKGLTDAGLIEDVTAKDYVTLCDYNAMEAVYSELAPTEEELDEQIDSLLNGYKEYSTEPGLVVEDGDTVNLDYAGTVDGVAFEGGTSQGGYDLVIGSGSFIDDFEEQLIGHKIGSEFDIEVTFPAEYPNNPDLAGKDAVFAITLNGLYVKPEFTDDFVKENLSDVALTADAYRQYLEEEGFETALNEYVETYILDNSVVNDCPDEYTEIMMGIKKYQAVQDYETMNEYYRTYLGVDLYGSFVEYAQVENELEYEAQLRLQAEDAVGESLIIQAIYEDAGLTVTSEHVDAVLADLGMASEMLPQMEEIYGKGYVYQLAVKEAVMEYLKENINVIK